MTATNGAVYEVTFSGPFLLDEVFAAFEGMSVESTATSVTVCGRLVDQAAVHGVLCRARQIGLDLVEMHKLRPEVEDWPQDGPPSRTDDS
jgi:hypothetical protein